MFLIDGHNLLWAVMEMPGCPQRLDEIVLCWYISRYVRAISETAEIVFDGTGPSDKAPFDNIGSLEVAFAGLATDADSVIEDRIKASHSPKRLTVVSNDRRIRRAAQAGKSVAMKTEMFWNDLRKEIAKKQQPGQEPSGKKHGLSDSETDQWLEYFKLDR